MTLFGTGTPLSKIVTDALPAMTASAIRVGLAAIVLAPFVVRGRSRIRSFSKMDWALVAAIALLGVVAFSVAMLHGMKLVSGVVGSIVMSTAPAVTALGARLFLGEKLGWRKSTAVALAVAGVLLLHLGGSEGGDSSDLVIGSLLVFAAVCCEASYTLLGKKMAEGADPMLVAGLAAMLAFVAFVPFAVRDLGAFDAARIELRSWIALGFWGAGTFGLGTMLWYSGVARSSGGTAAGFMGLMPVSALVLSYLLLGEPFRWVHLAGFAIVLAGVGLIAWDHATMRHDHPDAAHHEQHETPDRARRGGVRA